jgi:hypothetical protein
MNPTPPPPARKAPVKSVTATLYPAPVELQNLGDNATQIALRDSNGKPLGRVYVARVGIEFRGPNKRTGVRKTWAELIEWLTTQG